MKFLLSGMIFILGFEVVCQSVIGSAGQFDQNGPQIQWTIGETFVDRFDKGPLELGFNSAWSGSSTSVKPVEEYEPLTVFPNPCTSLLNFRLPTEWKQLTVFNEIGLAVWSQKKSDSNQLNVAEWPSGLYQIIVLDNEEDRYFAQFIKI